jgi:hypothetical protein
MSRHLWKVVPAVLGSIHPAMPRHPALVPVEGTGVTFNHPTKMQVLAMVLS